MGCSNSESSKDFLKLFGGPRHVLVFDFNSSAILWICMDRKPAWCISTVELNSFLFHRPSIHSRFSPEPKTLSCSICVLHGISPPPERTQITNSVEGDCDWRDLTNFCSFTRISFLWIWSLWVPRHGFPLIAESEEGLSLYSRSVCARSWCVLVCVGRMSGITRKGSGRPSYYYRLLGRTRLQRQRSRSRSRTRPANKGKGASDAFVGFSDNFVVTYIALAYWCFWVIFTWFY